jgi:hypothetical protein
MNIKKNELNLFILEGRSSNTREEKKNEDSLSLSHCVYYILSTCESFSRENIERRKLNRGFRIQINLFQKIENSSKISILFTIVEGIQSTKIKINNFIYSFLLK